MLISYGSKFLLKTIKCDLELVAYARMFFLELYVIEFQLNFLLRSLIKEIFGKIFINIKIFKELIFS